MGVKKILCDPLQVHSVAPWRTFDAVALDNLRFRRMLRQLDLLSQQHCRSLRAEFHVKSGTRDSETAACDAALDHQWVAVEGGSWPRFWIFF